MDSRTLEKFIHALFVLFPDFPLTGDEIRARIEKRGYGGFISDMDGRFRDLAETAVLLSMPGKGGGNGQREPV